MRNNTDMAVMNYFTSSTDAKYESRQVNLKLWNVKYTQPDGSVKLMEYITLKLFRF